MKKEILELVTTQLNTLEAQMDAKVQKWTTTIVQGCQEMADQIESIQKQLEDIQQRQTEFQALFDFILPRLE